MRYKEPYWWSWGLKINHFHVQNLVIPIYELRPGFITTISLRNVIDIAANAQNFKMAFIHFRNYNFQNYIKNLVIQCIILNTCKLENNEKFANHNLEKLCPWSLALASTIPVFGLEKVYPRKVGPWTRIFLSPWPWTLCPRLYICC